MPDCALSVASASPRGAAGAPFHPQTAPCSPHPAPQVALLARSIRVVGAKDTPGLGCHSIFYENFTGGLAFFYGGWACLRRTYMRAHVEGASSCPRQLWPPILPAAASPVPKRHTRTAAPQHPQPQSAPSFLKLPRRTPKNAAVHVEGVEFDNCGQTDSIGRYPVHFHMAARVPAGTYVRAASIHDSNFRAVTLHGTQGVLVERCAAVEIPGHAYFLEDGAEWDNTLRGNLGMLGEPTPARCCMAHSCCVLICAVHFRFVWLRGPWRGPCTLRAHSPALWPAAWPAQRRNPDGRSQPQSGSPAATSRARPISHARPVRAKTTGARLGSDQVGDNGDLSVFWITNPNNTFENNAAAATEGWGWFVHTRLSPRGLSKARWPGVRPSETPLRRFAGNSAHSVRLCIEMEADAVDAGDSPPVDPNSPPANWQPKNPDGSWAETLISGFTCHHAWHSGFWSRMGGVRMKDTAWADSTEAVQFATTGQHVSPPGTSFLVNAT